MRKPNISIILGKKLLTIRLWKGISQGEMLLLVIPQEDESNRSRVSEWERGTCEPPRGAQIRYSRIAGITLEVLLDDDQALPAHIKKPANRFNRRRNRGQHKKPVAAGVDAHEVRSPPASQKDPSSVTPAVSGSTDPCGGAEKKVTGKESTGGADWRTSKEITKMLFLTAEEACEPITFNLPVATLDRFHNMYLGSQLRMKRLARPCPTIAGIFNLAMCIMLSDYEYCEEESLIAKQILPNNSKYWTKLI